MSRLDELPPDQRAVLSLLVTQRKSYAEVAAMLAIPEQAVHDRAHAALAVLAPTQARQLTPDRREEVGDYLLGQRPGAAERVRTRALLSDSPAAVEWAQAVASELSPLGGAPAEIPEPVSASRSGAATPPPAARQAPPPAAAPTTGPAPPAAAPPEPASGPAPSAPAGPAPSAPAGPAPSAPAGPAPSAPAGPAPSESPPAAASAPPGARQLPSSRVGGAVLLGVIVVVAIVAIVLLSGGSSGKHKASTSTSTTGKPGSKVAVTSRIVMRPVEPGSRAIGAVDIVSEGSRHAFVIVAEHVPPSKGFFYAIWLYNSPSSHLALNRVPPVGSSGRLEGASLLPANAAEFHTILLTRETNARPSQPGPTVLRGNFTLSG
jgi:hypothetical protein